MTARRTKGLFITFEGGEGCGKSTQVKKLEKYLKARDYEVVSTREPGGTHVAESIRSILLDPGNETLSPVAELLLYEAARAQHVSERIMPALEAGKIVLSDRFYDSTTAYQGAGRGLGLEDLARLHALATGGLTPDLTIVIDVPADIGLARYRPRTKKRKHRQKQQMDLFDSDRIEREAIDFHERVRQGFLHLAEEQPRRVKVVDGQRPIQVVAEDVRALVDALLERL